MSARVSATGCSGPTCAPIWDCGRGDAPLGVPVVLEILLPDLPDGALDRHLRQTAPARPRRW